MDIEFEELKNVKFEANNPNFDRDNDVCHNWKNYVSSEWKENWFQFTERERQIIVFMAMEVADKEEWD